MNHENDDTTSCINGPATVGACYLAEATGDMSYYEKAKKLSDLAVKHGKKAVVHLALDTGMSRIGMKADREHAKEAASIAALEGIEV